MSQFSAYEQLLLELTNRARLDPAAEAQRLGISLNSGLAAGTIDASAKQPLAPNTLLKAAALSHTNWMLANDVFSHSGVAGSRAFARIEKAGYDFGNSWSWGENIAWLGTTATPPVASYVTQIHDNFMRSASHRANVLKTQYSELGVGISTGDFAPGGYHYNSVVADQNYARSGDKHFITGVTIKDFDRDNFYDIGEGVGSVRVSVRDHTSHAAIGSAVTGSAGGYAASAGNGSADVVFSGPSLPRSVAVTVDGQGQNVKLDLSGPSTVLSSATAQLGSGALNLTLLGSAAINATGNSANNQLTGNKANNILDGGAGADILKGGAGNDIYIIDTVRDLVVEAVNGGYDTIKTALAAYTLGSNVENLVLQSSANSSGIGNAANNAIYGGAGNDTLYGLSGNDTLVGGNGNDRLIGAAGTDVLIGGGGNDALWGGGHADRFVFAGHFGNDVVRDFGDLSGNQDVLRFSSTLFSSYAGLKASGAMVQSGDNVVISTADASVTLLHMRVAALGADDFSFF